MKSKLSFWLILIGLIIGISYSIWIVYGLFESQKILSNITHLNSQTIPNFELYTKVGMISSWGFVIIGFFLLVFIGINLLKNKNPNKRNFKFIIILSSIGIITSIVYGAILILIGGIIGYNTASN